MFLVGTVPLPDERSIAHASRRGFIITHHHFNLLGLDTFRWPSSMHDLWDWVRIILSISLICDFFKKVVDPQSMGYAWKAAIDAQKDFEVYWSVGYRGLNDYPAPCPGCSDKEKADHINTVIANQTQCNPKIHFLFLMRI